MSDRQLSLFDQIEELPQRGEVFEKDDGEIIHIVGVFNNGMKLDNGDWKRVEYVFWVNDRLTKRGQHTKGMILDRFKRKMGDREIWRIS